MYLEQKSRNMPQPVANMAGSFKDNRPRTNLPLAEPVNNTKTPSHCVFVWMAYTHINRVCIKHQLHTSKACSSMVLCELLKQWLACDDSLTHHCIQWNPSNPDTNQTEESVHISEGSLFQRLMHARTALGETLLEVSSFQGSVPLGTRQFAF